MTDDQKAARERVNEFVRIGYFPLSDLACAKLITDLRTLLSERDALAARVAVLEGEGEPVAWRGRFRTKWAVNSWSYSDGADKPPWSAWDGESGHDIEPLYVHPTPEALARAERAEDTPDLAPYDAGSLSDYGGGNVSWWQDYIRSELGTAHDFYQAQVIANWPAPQAEALTRAERAEVALSELHDAFRSWKAQTVKQEEAMRNAFAVISFLAPNPSEWTTSALSPSPATQTGE